MQWNKAKDDLSVYRSGPAIENDLWCAGENILAARSNKASHMECRRQFREANGVFFSSLLPLLKFPDVRADL